jgi:hypothetical protein
MLNPLSGASFGAEKRVHFSARCAWMPARYVSTLTSDFCPGLKIAHWPAKNPAQKAGLK